MDNFMVVMASVLQLKLPILLLRVVCFITYPSKTVISNYFYIKKNWLQYFLNSILVTNTLE